MMGHCHEALNSGPEGVHVNLTQKSVTKLFAVGSFLHIYREVGSHSRRSVERESVLNERMQAQRLANFEILNIDRAPKPNCVCVHDY